MPVAASGFIILGVDNGRCADPVRLDAVERHLGRRADIQPVSHEPVHPIDRDPAQPALGPAFAIPAGPHQHASGIGRPPEEMEGDVQIVGGRHHSSAFKIDDRHPMPAVILHMQKLRLTQRHLLGTPDHDGLGPVRR